MAFPNRNTLMTNCLIPPVRYPPCTVIGGRGSVIALKDIQVTKHSGGTWSTSGSQAASPQFLGIPPKTATTCGLCGWYLPVDTSEFLVRRPTWHSFGDSAHGLLHIDLVLSSVPIAVQYTHSLDGSISCKWLVLKVSSFTMRIQASSLRRHVLFAKL